MFCATNNFHSGCLAKEFLITFVSILTIRNNFNAMKKFILWTLIIFIILVGPFVYWKYFYTYSEGYRAGLLQKFSYRGNIFKTYEGEMILSSVESNRNVPLASEKFYFSVKDRNVVNKMEQLQGYFIVVHYNQKNGKLMWRGETPYFVDSVRVVTEIESTKQ
jgi:hypothetical protein